MDKDRKDNDWADIEWMDTGWETARENKSGSRRNIKDGNKSGRGRTKRERSDREQRRKKRKRRRMFTNAVIAILAVALGAIILMSVLRIRTLRAFSGDYTRTVDMTDRIVANTAIWLKDVEGADVSAEWIMNKTEPLLITIGISFDPEGLKSGSFTEEPDNASYIECSDRAYKLTADCLRELIIKRLTMVGYAESVSDQEADALIEEALGMSLDNYIKNAGVKIMPDYDEIVQEFTRAGDYRIDKTTIVWMRDGEEKTDAFKTVNDTLIIMDPGYIYER